MKPKDVNRLSQKGGWWGRERGRGRGRGGGDELFGYLFLFIFCCFLFFFSDEIFGFGECY